MPMQQRSLSNSCKSLKTVHFRKVCWPGNSKKICQPLFVSEILQASLNKTTAKKQIQTTKFHFIAAVETKAKTL